MIIAISLSGVLEVVGYVVLVLVALAMAGGLITIVYFGPLYLFAQSKGKQIKDLTEEEMNEFAREQNEFRMNSYLLPKPPMW